MKIKIIDLLVKIANNEELPKKIKYKNEILKEEKIYVYYDWAAGYYEDGYAGKIDYKLLHNRNEQYEKILNSEVEIIEENPKKIEEITINENGTLGFPNGNWTARNMDKAFASKINELTERVNYLLEKSDKDEC